MTMHAYGYQRPVLCMTVAQHTLLCPPPQGALSDTAIRPSVCPSPRRTAALGYRHAGCLQISHVRTSLCGLLTRRVELPSAGSCRLAASRAITGFLGSTWGLLDNTMNPTLHVAYVINFYPRDDMLARYRIGPTRCSTISVCVCLSVCHLSRDVHETFSAETETRLRPRRYKLPRRCRDVW